LWGGQDLNLRPTDHESDSIRSADLRRLTDTAADLRLLNRSLPDGPGRSDAPADSARTRGFSARVRSSAVTGRGRRRLPVPRKTESRSSVTSSPDDSGAAPDLPTACLRHHQVDSVLLQQDGTSGLPSRVKVSLQQEPELPPVDQVVGNEQCASVIAHANRRAALAASNTTCRGSPSTDPPPRCYGPVRPRAGTTARRRCGGLPADAIEFGGEERVTIENFGASAVLGRGRAAAAARQEGQTPQHADAGASHHHPPSASSCQLLHGAARHDDVHRRQRRRNILHPRGATID